MTEYFTKKKDYLILFHFNRYEKVEHVQLSSYYNNETPLTCLGDKEKFGFFRRPVQQNLKIVLRYWKK